MDKCSQKILANRRLGFQDANSIPSNVPRVWPSQPRKTRWRSSHLCALAIQFDLVPIGITDINGKAVVLLHRFFGKPVRNQSIARLLCLFRWDKQCKVLATAWPIMSKQRQTLRSDAKPGLLRPHANTRVTRGCHNKRQSTAQDLALQTQSRESPAPECRPYEPAIYLCVPGLTRIRQSFVIKANIFSSN